MLRKIGRDHRQRRGEEVLREPPCRFRAPKIPRINKVSQAMSVEPCAAAIELLVLRLDPPFVAVCVWEHLVEPTVTQASSASLTVIASMVSERFVPSYWPTNPSD